MGEVLKEWFRKTLGVLMELTPELFGHYTRDGNMLAKILHTYGIINNDQLDTIIKTEDPTLCRVNLNYLRVWLRFIGVDCTEDCINEISCGKGATALQLFYKVYLCLEGKDNLYFVTLQKEREKYIPNSRKFDVIPIQEEATPYEPPDHPLSKPLTKASSTIKWHRNKFQDVLKSCRRERKKLESLKWKPSNKIDIIEPILPKVFCDTTKGDDILKEMDDFARKHRIKTSKRDVYDPCLTDQMYDEIEISAEDPEAAKAYVSWLKDRKRKENVENAVKSRMQNMLLSELWKALSDKQEKIYDESLALRALDYSHYEKQMITKLLEVRNYKNVVTENRKIVNQLMMDAKESKMRMEEVRKREELYWESEDVDSEYQRLCELHRRILKEKLKKLREKHERICREAVQDLIDVALKVAEYRSSNEGYVPKVIWKEWKTLFLRCQPIFEPFEDEFFKDEEGERIEEIEEIVRSLTYREKALNEANFESYHTLESPWDDYVPPIETEIEEIMKLGELVLGYIVHRLLEFVYPYPIGPVEPPVSRVKTAAIILGVVEQSLYNPIQLLLKKSGIRLVSMKDAINYCLLRYKEEMLDVRYVDANIVRATEEIFQKSTVSKRKSEDSKKNTFTARSRKTLRSSKISAMTKDKNEKGKNAEKDLKEKETQTPRVIPYDDMDPILSNVAYVGKCTYEFLILGQPISNELSTRILLEYLRSLVDVEGWALIDYPNSYDQMARLEYALTGRKIPPDPTVVNFDNVNNIEEIDPVSPRIVYEDTEIDDYAIYRQSKLLPNPITKREISDTTTSRTFMTAYVRAIPKPKNLDVDPNNLVEVLSEDATVLDEFYADQSVAYVVYYDYFDIHTIKKIARLVIGEKSLPRIPSVELFGNVVASLEEEEEEEDKSLNRKAFLEKKSIARRILSKPTIVSKEKEEEEEDEGREEEEEEEKMKIDVEASGDYIDVSRAPKPGEDGWEWIDFPQSPVLLDALATLWENIEEIYIVDLMEIFSLKRTHSSAIVPYKDFVMRNMKEFIERPDTKQILLEEFQRSYNDDISEDMRDDEEVKCELHCRLTDFQTQLWNICDSRRLEAEEERQKIVREGWTDVEAVTLVNIYISILQAEIDRSVDTLQMIQDYYTSMLQKPIQESRLSKILLDRLKISQKDEVSHLPSYKLSHFHIEKDKKNKKDTKSRIDSERFDYVKPIIDPNEITREITNLFVNVEDATTIFDSSESIVYKAIFDNVDYVSNFLQFIATIVDDALKKEENILTTTEKSRERTWRKGELSADPVLEKLRTRGQDLIQEWRYATLYEVNRMRIRLKVLLAAAEADVAFLLDTMRFVFRRTYERIVDRYCCLREGGKKKKKKKKRKYRYRKEKNSVDDMIKIFCFAIEEEKPIQEELILDGENFYVRPDVLMFPTKPEPPPKLTRETIKPSLFTISQLGRLMNVFRTIAPSGTLPERSLVYVLQDMISYNKEEEDDGYGSMPVPMCWRLLRSCDVSKLVENIFGRCEYVDWREFLIYAMDLPTPTQEDILCARDRYRTLDLDSKEIVTRDQYRSVPLWFFKYTYYDSSSDIQHILFDDFQRSFEELFEEEKDFVNPDKLLGTIIPERAMDYVRSLRVSRGINDDVLLEDEEEKIMVQRDAEEALRLMLAKELLCQMYLIDRYSVNYTALLLAFCKDEDPREGLGKALSLAIGARVCTDFEEGEKYAERILKEKLLSVQLESMKRLLHEEAIQVILINTLFKITFDSKNELEASSMMFESYQEFEERIEREMIHWLPFHVCMAVLLATLPWHASQPDLFQTTKTLPQLLRDVYDDLYDEELSNEKDIVLSHRFLNHNFIIKLLNSTSKFVVKHLGNLFSEIITEERERNP
ncbi:sperm flagellar protein 2-like [Vespa crabro]|uniref:sperm flagellar protein 2-like n=1 Tax=Vespa crabro TaxID=7445 RepID=UPI001EFF9E5C|nr:sperm flagellar protein 2-like [Vespa crabro]